MSTGLRISGGCLVAAVCLAVGTCLDGYRQARRCSDDTLADVWMTTADAAMFPGAFTLLNGTFGYYFGSDTGTPGTIYTASEATAYANCAAIASGCPNGDCIDHADDTASHTIDFSGPWDLVACGQTSDTAAATTQPMTLTVSGCTYVTDGSACQFPAPTAGQIYRFSAPQIAVTNTYAGGSGSLCWYYYIQLSFQDFHGGPSRTVYYRGPRLDGTGSAAGLYYWWYDFTSTLASVDENDIATDGCTFGNVTPTLTVV